jgi:hypothetical protein
MQYLQSWMLNISLIRVLFILYHTMLDALVLLQLSTSINAFNAILMIMCLKNFVIFHFDIYLKVLSKNPQKSELFFTHFVYIFLCCSGIIIRFVFIYIHLLNVLFIRLFLMFDFERIYSKSSYNMLLFLKSPMVALIKALYMYS